MHAIDTIYADLQLFQQQQVLPFNTVTTKHDLLEPSKVFAAVRYLSEHLLVRLSGDTIHICNHLVDAVALFRSSDMCFESYHHHIGVYTNTSNLLKLRNINKQRLATTKKMLALHAGCNQLNIFSLLHRHQVYRSQLLPVAQKYTERIVALKKDIHQLTAVYQLHKDAVPASLLSSQRSLYRTSQTDRLAEMQRVLTDLHGRLYPMNIVDKMQEYSSLGGTFLLAEESQPVSDSKDSTGQRKGDLDEATAAFNRNLNESIRLMSRESDSGGELEETLASMVETHRTRVSRLKLLKGKLELLLAEDGTASRAPDS